ncbi:hypothetical protein BMAJHU_F0253 [Burkholderia mallei JHU]|nr:hypothetical protein BMAJHU_F0253 [Burkholderia mallei JHU]
MRRAATKFSAPPCAPADSATSPRRRMTGRRSDITAQAAGSALARSPPLANDRARP